MIRFIWQNWWRQKERFILLLVGALVISSGLSYLFGTTQASHEEVTGTLQDEWKATYDIVVRPPGSRSVTEDKHLLEPDYLSGLSGGITLDQYHQIQKIDGVAVAAPIAMIGYIRYNVALKAIQIHKKGIYQFKRKTITDLGPRSVTDNVTYYFAREWGRAARFPKPGYGLTNFDGNLKTGTLVLVAGIDPEAEAKLAGLDKAVLKIGKSRYFREEDHATNHKGKVTNSGRFKIPILVSNRQFVDATYQYSISRLNLSSDHPKKVLSTIRKKGGAKYLDTFETTNSQTYTFSAEQAHRHLIQGITGVDPQTGMPVSSQPKVRKYVIMPYKPTPLEFQPITSPQPQKWPYAYNLKTYHVTDEDTGVPVGVKELFRPVKTFGPKFNGFPRLELNWVGFYDPKRLNLPKDPLTELPAETYRPASAQLVLDGHRDPVNPPVKMKPEDSAFGLLTKPPTVLTTLDAAAKILGDKPISAIRIQVVGVQDLSQESQFKLEKIAQKIERRTSLITDITLGSSPQPALTHIPAVGDRPELGWIEQPWVKLKASFGIFTETNVGLSGVVGALLLVAVVYVFTSSLMILLARRKEYAVLLAVGWRPGQLWKMVLLEAAILGGFAAIVAWVILGWVLFIRHAELSFFRFLLAGLLGFILYGIGMGGPALLLHGIRPIEALQSGEVSKASRRLIPTRSLFTMSLNHFLATWRRSLLSIFAIAVPTALLAFLLFVTFRLKGVMLGTLLGQYVALQIGPAHYAAMAVALFIAILTTAEIMWQNVSERQQEMALLKASGWRDGSIRRLVLLEGGINGLGGGIVGLILAFVVMVWMYNTLSFNHIGILMATGLIPIVIGLLGATLPAQKAVNLQPSVGMSGRYGNSKITEKRFLIGLGTVAVILGIGLASLGVHTMMNKNEATTSAPATRKVSTSIDDSKEQSKTGDSQANEKDSSYLKKYVNNYVKEYLDPAIHWKLNHYTIRHLKLGEHLKDYTSDFWVDKMDAPPPGAKLKEPSEGMKYVSFRVSYKLNINFGDYRPWLMQIKTKQGLKNEANWTVLENKNWNMSKFVQAGEAIISMTFEVPKDEEHFKLVLIPYKLGVRLIVIDAS